MGSSRDNPGHQARPKSSRRSSPSRPRWRFSGLRSRCSRLRRCNWPSPRSSWLASPSHSGSDSGPWLRKRSARVSGVLAHQVIQMLALRQSVQLGEMPALDAAQEPFLEQQGLGCQRIVGTCGGKGLQQPGLALAIFDPVEQGLAGFAEQLPDPPAFEELVGLQRWRQWPVAQLREGVAEAACGHGFHAYQQGAGVVLAACQVGGANQGLGAAAAPRRCAGCCGCRCRPASPRRRR